MSEPVRQEQVVKDMKTLSVVAIATVITLASCGGDDVTGSDSDSAPVPSPVATSSAPTSPTSEPSPTPPSTTATTSVPTPATSATSDPAVLPVVDDVAYAPLSELQRLDVYTPAVGDPPYPVAIIIHGGGWTVGDKRGELPLSAIPGFLDLGYAVASVNYRLAPDAVFPAQLLDVKAATRYLRANADALGLDPERFVAIGESAGAHLASLLGVTADRPEFDDPAFGNPDISSVVQAVVAFYGPSDLTTSDTQRTLNPPCPAEPDPNIALLLGASPIDAPELAAAASPVTYLEPGSDPPPFFIAHGDADCVVPYQQSVELSDAIEAVAPGRSQLTLVAGSGHYLDFDFQSTNEAVVAFLADTLGP